MPTKTECEDHREKIYERINQEREELAEIRGGISALKWFLPIVISLLVLILGAYANFRFNAMEHDVDRIVDHLLRPENTANTSETENNTP